MSKPHIQIEYDVNYYGGDYLKVGQFVYIPLEEIENSPLEEKEAVNAAFKRCTGKNPVHIIHWTLDSLYTADGQQWNNNIEDVVQEEDDTTDEYTVEELTGEM